MFTNITLESWLILGGYVSSSFYFVHNMKTEIKLLAKDITLQNTKIDNQAQQINQIGQILTAQAVASERMNNLDKQIQDLRAGRGFIVNTPHDAFNPAVGSIG